MTRWATSLGRVDLLECTADSASCMPASMPANQLARSLDKGARVLSWAKQQCRGARQAFAARLRCVCEFGHPTRHFFVLDKILFFGECKRAPKQFARKALQNASSYAPVAINCKV